jgi:hypothetical protein
VVLFAGVKLVLNRLQVLDDAPARLVAADHDSAAFLRICGDSFGLDALE